MDQRKRRQEPNPVAVAIAAVGGPTKTANLCGVSNVSVHAWRNAGRIPQAQHAVILAKATGIRLEALLGVAGEKGDNGAAAGGKHRPARPKRHAARAPALRASAR